MLRRLVLRNWKSHEETSLEFGKGTNILVGIMGSGKSSALEAISFALFGTFPSVLHHRMKIADAIMSLPVGKSEASVELEFEWGGAQYSVKRGIYAKGGADAELRKDGGLVMSDPEKVTEEIVRLLGMDYDLFYRAVYAEQNRMDYFLGLAPGERKRQVDELLGIDRFEEARSASSTVINSLKKMKGEGEREILGFDAKALEQRKAAARNEIDALAGERRKIEAGLGDARSLRERAEQEFSSLGKLKQEWESLRQKQAGLGHAAKENEEEAARKEAKAGKLDADALGKEVAEGEAGEKRLKMGLRAASAGLADLKGKEGALKAAISELESKSRKNAEIEAVLSAIPGGLAGAQARLADARKGRDDAGRMLAEADAKGKELRESISQLEIEGGAECPVCERPIGEGLRSGLLEGKRQRLEALLKSAELSSKRMAEAEARIVEAETSLSEAKVASTRLADFAGAGAKLAEFTGMLDSVKEEIGKAAASQSDAEKRLDAASSGLAGARQGLSLAREISSLRARARAAALELGAVEKQLGALKFDEKAFDGARRSAAELREKCAQLGGELRVAEEKAKAAQERLEVSERELKALSEKAARVAKLQKASESVSIFQSSLVETQAALREEMIGAINAKMGELWPVVYPYGDYRGIALSAGKDDYSLELKLGEAWVPVDGFASGGERACASLVLRVALALVIVPVLRWMVLDEPTHNLDEQGIRALIDVLRERMPEIVEQVFVITHDENLKEAASARLYRFERNKDANEPTRALELT